MEKIEKLICEYSSLLEELGEKVRDEYNFLDYFEDRKSREYLEARHQWELLEMKYNTIQEIVWNLQKKCRN